MARGNQVHRRVHDFAERIHGVINELDAVQKQLLRLLIEEVRVTGNVEIRLHIALDEPPPNPQEPTPAQP